MSKMNTLKQVLEDKGIAKNSEVLFHKDLRPCIVLEISGSTEVKDPLGNPCNINFYDEFEIPFEEALRLAENIKKYIEE